MAMHIDLRKTGFMKGAQYSGMNLTIEFKNGAIRCYHAVPGNIWHAFSTSKSPGKYYTDNIKEQYLVTVLKSGPPPKQKPGDQTKLYFKH